MEKLYTVHLEENEIELLLTICRRSFGRTTDPDRRKMLGLICDSLDATIVADMMLKAQHNLDALKASMEEHKKSEKRKHFRIEMEDFD